jgi:hypothetical protein
VGGRNKALREDFGARNLMQNTALFADFGARPQTAKKGSVPPCACPSTLRFLTSDASGAMFAHWKRCADLDAIECARKRAQSPGNFPLQQKRNSREAKILQQCAKYGRNCSLGPYTFFNVGRASILVGLD